MVSASERLSLEREFGLIAATQQNDDTRGYVPTKTSPDALRAIVTHPSVANTDGIDRSAFTISDSPPLSPRRGGLLEAPMIARMAGLLAYALACFAGVWLLRSALVFSPLTTRLTVSAGAQWAGADVHGNSHGAVPDGAREDATTNRVFDADY